MNIAFTRVPDTKSLSGLFTADARGRVARCEVVATVASTNSVLLESAPPTPGAAHVLWALEQTGGRGRRGRPWIARGDGAICLSIAWTFESAPRDLAALSLVMGVCVLRVVEAQGITGVALKWPNDVVASGGKLAGILIEARTDAIGPTLVVIGVGLNVALDVRTHAEIVETGTIPVDLVSLGLTHPDRTRLAAALICEMVRALPDFAAAGLESFDADWRRADSLRGREVSLQVGDEHARGLARGIDAHGALLLDTPAGLRRIVAGEVSA